MPIKPFSATDMRYPCLTYADEVAEANMVPEEAYDATGGLRVERGAHAALYGSRRVRGGERAGMVRSGCGIGARDWVKGAG